MRLDFVINPNAGRIDVGSLTDALRSRFDGWQVNFVSSPDQVQPADGGPRMVVAVGGDGTVSRVINASIPGPMRLGILPFGTANDFAAGLGIPGDFAGACDVLARQVVRRVDLIRVNDWRVATCGGIGFAVDVAQQANAWKESRIRALVKMLGPLVYPLATMRRLAAGRRTIRARVTAQSLVQDVRLSTAMVSNQPRFGGRFCTSPKANNQDGKLDLCLIRQSRTSLDLTRVAARIYQGQPDRCPETMQLQTHEVTLETESPVPFFADGELLGTSDHFHMRTEPAALEVAALA